MTEQQYHVIADRDKGDDPKWPDIEPGDRYVAIARDLETRSDDDQVVRIERPVPTTDEPQKPSVPMREQIAVELIEKLRTTGSVPIDRVWSRWRELFREYDDAVLALIQKEDKK